MGDATTKVKTLPTNAQWQHCGPADPQVKELLAKLNKTSKKSRIEWLKDLCKTPLPSGPYPFHVPKRGWFKGHICDERYQACYVIRKDLNLDVQIFEAIRGPSGRIVERVLVQDADQRIRIRVCKVELWSTFAVLYPQESAKITVVWEIAEVTVGTLLALIMREVELWKEYDAETIESLRLTKQVQQGPAQCEVICLGHADDHVLLEAMQKDVKAREEGCRRYAQCPHHRAEARWKHMGLREDGSKIDRKSFAQVMSSNVVNITAGGCCHTMLQDGSVWTTGWKKYGQLGDGSRTDAPHYIQVVASGIQL